MKETYTEQDILSYPEGEHDYFDRKEAGYIFGNPKFPDNLAKTLSAMANSGGGQILIGVTDKGELDGIPIHLEGNPKKQRVREWLEQKIPSLLEKELTKFRVHEIEKSENSKLANDKTVLVIDIPDSIHAPHQVRKEKVYYYRAGGHSMKAPHFYLETLHNRLQKPILTPEILGIKLLRGKYNEELKTLYVSLIVEFNLSNKGNIKCERWSPFLIANHQGGTHPDCGSGEGAGYPCMIKYNGGDLQHGFLKYNHLEKLNMLHSDKHVSREKKVTVKSNSDPHWYAKP